MCDSWYTSIHPGKGTYTFNDIIKIYDENPTITEMMLTGGSPTMQPDLCNELTHFANERGIFITIETEGSHFVETDYPIGLISLSPKFANSVPALDIETPMGKLVDQKMVDQHNKLRLNHEAIAQTLAYHSDYHYKPVYDGTEENIQEIEEFNGVIYHYNKARVVEEGEIARLQFGYTIVHPGNFNIDDLNSNEKFRIIMGDILTEILTRKTQDEQIRTDYSKEPDTQ